MSLGTGVLGLGATIIQFDIWLFTKKETNDFFLYHIGWNAFTSRETNLTCDTKINQTNFKFSTASR